MASHDPDRAVAFSRQLTEAHQHLRGRIQQLRASLGKRHPDDNALVTHCLAFCAALTAHHQGEDRGMFTALLRDRPDLAPAVANLVEDHEMIAAILARVAELAEQALRSDAPELAAIGREFDGLAAIVESHFAYEERAIGAALDGGISDTGWSEAVFEFRGPRR